jgi:hypothetical protein
MEEEAQGDSRMIEIKQVKQSRSVDSGHAIEVDFILNDGSVETIKMPYERVPHTMHALTSAASVAETAQKVAASGLPNFAVVVPYQAHDVRAGQSPDGTVAVEFATLQGPVQVAMTTDLVRLTIQRLTSQLGKIGMQFPKLS